MSQNPNLFLSINKPVKDEYGRVIGKVASLAMTPSGQFDAVFVEFNGGRFSKQPIQQLKFNGADVTFVSSTKSQASILCDQIPLIWRKDQALKDLSDKKKISSDMYQEIHKSFNGILSQLKKDAQILSDDIADQIGCCEEEIKAMNYAILNLELEHEIGKVDDDAYKAAFNNLQENLKRVLAERNELEQAKSKLSNMVLGESMPILTKMKPLDETPVETKAELPEPPVVVYVKEVGKAGI
jgi:hypothetical protein